MGHTLEQICLMTEAEYRAAASAARREEQDAYHRYCGGTVVPAAAPGTPHAAGLGSWVCDLNAGGVQDAWYAARAAAERLEAIRGGTQYWRLESVGTEVATFVLRWDFRAHALEVACHGVDVSDCRTPAEAVARIRATA